MRRRRDPIWVEMEEALAVGLDQSCDRALSFRLVGL
jgi:hypothetical protein